MKIINTLDCIVISTNLKAEEIEKANRYAPASLAVMENEIPVFAINKSNSGNVSNRGIEFDSVKPDGTMYVSFTRPGLGELTAEKRKEILQNDFGIVLFNLKRIEEQVAAALNIVATDIASVEASIVLTD